jgi:hypothetical protein
MNSKVPTQAESYITKNQARHSESGLWFEHPDDINHTIGYHKSHCGDSGNTIVFLDGSKAVFNDSGQCVKTYPVDEEWANHFSDAEIEYRKQTKESAKEWIQSLIEEGSLPKSESWRLDAI